MSNEEFVRHLLKAYLKGGTEIKLDSDFGRGYIKALETTLQELERLERDFDLTVTKGK
jgi:hypothetical protein